MSRYLKEAIIEPGQKVGSVGAVTPSKDNKADLEGISLNERLCSWLFSVSGPYR